MTIGWIGVGQMGRPIIEKLYEHNYSLVIYDVDPAAYGRLRSEYFNVAENPCAMAESCEMIFLCLPSKSAVEDVVLGKNGILGRNGSGAKIIVNCSTIGSESVERISKKAAEQNVSVVDCPISGGPDAARKAVLSVMLSGAANDIERVRPVLERVSATITVLGERPGLAQIAKLINNLVILTAYVGTLEAITLGKKAGIKVEAMLEAINGGILAPNGTTRIWLPEYILKKREFGGKLRMMVKDIDSALAEARQYEMRMLSAEITGIIARNAVHAGFGERDITSLAEFIENSTGLQRS